MSETVRFKGKLVPISGITPVEEYIKMMKLDETGDINLPNYYDNYEEWLVSEHYQQYTVLNNKVYKIEKTRLDPEQNIFNATLNKDNEYEYEVMYYNGGMSLDEALQKAIEKSNK